MTTKRIRKRHADILRTVMQTGRKGEHHGNAIRAQIRLGFLEVIKAAPTAANQEYRVTKRGLDMLNPPIEYSDSPISWDWWTPYIYAVPQNVTVDLICPHSKCNHPHTFKITDFYPRVGATGNGPNGRLYLYNNAKYHCPECQAFWDGDQILTNKDNGQTLRSVILEYVEDES
jgi:hypothetical protein